MDPVQYDGLIGDYVGGVYGTGFTALAAVVAFFAWWTTRRTEYRAKTYQVFAELLRTHEEIVSSIALGNARGRDAISVILSEFNFIYRSTKHFVPDDKTWTMAQRIDVAYTYAYYGPYLQTQQVLSKYDPALLKLVADSIKRKQQRNSTAGTPRAQLRLFKGHQNRLSHYFRNLYTAYSFIEHSKLSPDEKLALGRVLRAKLSNYEQALLTLNVLCHLGEEWVNTGLISKYRPIKNVPKNFFSFDARFDLKTIFPYVVFEWEAPPTRPKHKKFWSFQHPPT